MKHSDLIRIQTALAAGLPLPNDLASELMRAIDRFRRGECKTLCAALKLRAAGLSSVATREAIDRRNELIRTIARQYEGQPWEVAGIIAAKTRNKSRDPIYQMLFKTGARMVYCQTGIYKILTKP